MSERRVFVALTIVAALVVTRPLRAEDGASMQQAAADLFRAGEAAYERQDYRAAALAFEEAHRRVPRAATLLNAGLAWQAAKEPPRAADDFAAALALGVTDGAAADDARTRLADVERECGLLDVRSQAAARIDVGHVQDAPLPVVVHLRPGKYTVTVRFGDGGRTRSTVEIERGKKSELSMLAPRSDVAPPAEPPRSGSPQKTIGWVGIAVGAALGVAAGALGGATLSARSDLEASNDTDASARSRAVRLRTLTNVAAVSALLIGATGIVVVVTAPASGTGTGAMAGFRAAF